MGIESYRPAPPPPPNKALKLRAAIVAAERSIQDILLTLANEHGAEFDHVDVDTRNFGNYRVSIIEKDGGQ
jgi:hypothetical protein